MQTYLKVICLFLVLFILSHAVLFSEESESKELIIGRKGAELGDTIYAYTLPGVYLFMLDLQLTDPDMYHELIPAYSGMMRKDAFANIGGILLMSAGVATITVALGIYIAQVVATECCNLFGLLTCDSSYQSADPEFGPELGLAVGIGGGITVLGAVVFFLRVNRGDIKLFYRKYNDRQFYK